MFSKAKTGKSSETNDAGPSRSEQSVNAPTPPQSSRRANSSKAIPGVPSIISGDVVLRGNIVSSGEIQFDGTLEGDIKAGSLIIGDHAEVKGEVICEAVVVRGRVEGAIRAKSVSLAQSAHIEGDILHSSLSVETGAHFEGNCRHSDDPLSDSSATDFRRSRPSAAAPAPRPASVDDGDKDTKKAANGNNNAPAFLSQQNRSPLR